MSKKSKPPRATREKLERTILELKAQLAHSYHFADATIGKAGVNLMGSGVLLQLTGLGGNEIIPPVMIRDGLSEETIAALRKDLARSYELAVAYKPSESKKD